MLRNSDTRLGFCRKWLGFVIMCGYPVRGLERSSWPCLQASKQAFIKGSWLLIPNQSIEVKDN
jgi:hypothetical protein